MAITLVINPGSTSKKFAFYNSQELLLSVRFEETGTGFDVCVEKKRMRGKCEEVSASTYVHALTDALRRATEEKIISSSQDVSYVGIRVVAPGTAFQKHARIDAEYLVALAKAEKFAPLHIPAARTAIDEVKKVLPDAAIIAVSDSAFHCTLPPEASEYSLPRADVAEFELRRYGYHGISVSSVATRLDSFFSGIPERTIVCHVGGGISITALKQGVSIETSMGFTPATGIIMGSRAGDVDGGALAAVVDARSLRGNALHTYLHNEGGFQGVAGVKDMRLVLNKYADGDEGAHLAINMLLHQFTKIIGSYYAVLGGLDAVVLTATAMERNPELRALLLSRLHALGIQIDSEKNEERINSEGFIQSAESAVKIAVMKTDEMGQMARVVEEFT